MILCLLVCHGSWLLWSAAIVKGRLKPGKASRHATPVAPGPSTPPAGLLVVVPSFWLAVVVGFACAGFFCFFQLGMFRVGDVRKGMGGC